MAVVVLALLLASPATADMPFKLFVDDKPIAQPIVMVENTTYVPIRAVADIFKATTDWNFETKTISIKTKPVDIKEIKRPPIQGDEEFTGKINAALDLLEEKDFPHYLMVCQNTWGINQVKVKPEDVADNVLAQSFAGATIIFPLIMDDPKRYTPIYLAGILVHEACHETNWNYHRDLSEKEAYAHELAAYRLLNAPKWRIDEAELALSEYSK